MIHMNLGSHDGRTLDELTSLVEVTERAAFTPRVLSPEELAQAEDAFHFDLRSDFDETEFEEEAE